MKVGVVLPTYRGLASAENIVRAARLAEELDFDSIWTTDHVVIPDGEETQFGRDIFDPLATLAFAAGMTRRVELGIAVLVIPYRHPVPVAKELATIDQLSGGRVILGAGLGWLPAEFQALGQDVRRRASQTEDAIAAMRSLWGEQPASHDGRHFRFQRVYSGPRPAQPRLPVWLGGVSDAALDRAARIGDGWISDGQTFDELGPALRKLGARLEAHGRHREEFTVALRIGVQVVAQADAITASQAVRGHMGDQEQVVGRVPFRGTPEQVAADLRHAAGMGIDHLIFEFPISRGEESMDLFEPLAGIRRQAGV